MRAIPAFLHGSAPYHLLLSGPSPHALWLSLDNPWPGDAKRGAKLLAGPPPDWPASTRDPDAIAPQCFGWLSDLAALGGDEARQCARDWTADWLERYALVETPSWRADVIGDRLFAWIAHFDWLAGPEGDPLRAGLLSSFARQARHLARTAPLHPEGLERLRAYRGLVAALAALGWRRRFAQALDRSEREIARQILPDGGHAARGPAAQQEALVALIDLRAALAGAGTAIPAWLESAIERAAAMLRFFRHGDGRQALFNGAQEDDAERLERVLARAGAKARPPQSAPDTGFERLQGGRSLVIMDCGRPPLTGFDAAAHAGTLSFEMSYGRDRLVVNCGGYGGRIPEWRLAARATAAHSTLVIADTNSTELCADGTLGRGPEDVSAERAEEDGNQWVAASHDGYHPVFGLTHARQLFLTADGDDLRGEDRLTGAAGRGFVIRFHLHPMVEATLSADGKAAVMRLPGGTAWRLRTEGAVLGIGESIYLGQGEPKKTQQVILEGHVGTNGATVHWAIRREAAKPVETEEAALDL